MTVRCVCSDLVLCKNASAKSRLINGANVPISRHDQLAQLTVPLIYLQRCPAATTSTTAQAFFFQKHALAWILQTANVIDRSRNVGL